MINLKKERLAVYAYLLLVLTMIFGLSFTVQGSKITGNFIFDAAEMISGISMLHINMLLFGLLSFFVLVLVLRHNIKSHPPGKKMRFFAGAAILILGTGLLSFGIYNGFGNDGITGAVVGMEKVSGMQTSGGVPVTSPASSALKDGSPSVLYYDSIVETGRIDPKTGLGIMAVKIGGKVYDISEDFEGEYINYVYNGQTIRFDLGKNNGVLDRHSIPQNIMPNLVPVDPNDPSKGYIVGPQSSEYPGSPSLYVEAGITVEDANSGDAVLEDEYARELKEWYEPYIDKQAESIILDKPIFERFDEDYDYYGLARSAEGDWRLIYIPNGEGVILVQRSDGSFKARDLVTGRDAEYTIPKKLAELSKQASDNNIPNFFYGESMPNSVDSAGLEVKSSKPVEFTDLSGKNVIGIPGETVKVFDEEKEGYSYIYIPESSELRELIGEASRGDPNALYLLGKKFFLRDEELKIRVEIEGIEDIWAATDAVAYSLLSRAAENGNVESEYYLGVLNEETLKDYPTAMEFYQKVANQGDPNGFLRLGQMYQKGLGVPVDSRKSIDLYVEAFKSGLNKENFEESMSGVLYSDFFGFAVYKNEFSAIDPSTWFKGNELQTITPDQKILSIRDALGSNEIIYDGENIGEIGRVDGAVAWEDSEAADNFRNENALLAKLIENYKFTAEEIDYWAHNHGNSLTYLGLGEFQRYYSEKYPVGDDGSLKVETGQSTSPADTDENLPEIEILVPDAYRLDSNKNPVELAQASANTVAIEPVKEGGFLGFFQDYVGDRVTVDTPNGRVEFMLEPGKSTVKTRILEIAKNPASSSVGEIKALSLDPILTEKLLDIYVKTTGRRAELSRGVEYAAISATEIKYASDADIVVSDDDEIDAGDSDIVVAQAPVSPPNLDPFKSIPGVTNDREARWLYNTAEGSLEIAKKVMEISGETDNTISKAANAYWLYEATKIYLGGDLEQARQFREIENSGSGGGASELIKASEGDIMLAKRIMQVGGKESGKGGDGEIKTRAFNAVALFEAAGRDIKQAERAMESSGSASGHDGARYLKGLISIGDAQSQLASAQGSYSENKELVDALYVYGFLKTSEQYNDVNGAGLFNVEEDMDTVRAYVEGKDPAGVKGSVYKATKEVAGILDINDKKSAGPQPGDVLTPPLTGLDENLIIREDGMGVGEDSSKIYELKGGKWADTGGVEIKRSPTPTPPAAQAPQQAPAAETAEQKIWILYLESTSAMEKGEFDKAVSIYDEILNFPEVSGYAKQFYLQRKGDSLYSAKKYDEADIVYREAADAYPRSSVGIASSIPNGVYTIDSEGYVKDVNGWVLDKLKQDEIQGLEGMVEKRRVDGAWRLVKIEEPTQIAQGPPPTKLEPGATIPPPAAPAPVPPAPSISKPRELVDSGKDTWILQLDGTYKWTKTDDNNIYLVAEYDGNVLRVTDSSYSEYMAGMEFEAQPKPVSPVSPPPAAPVPRPAVPPPAAPVPAPPPSAQLEPDQNAERITVNGFTYSQTSDGTVIYLDSIGIWQSRSSNFKGFESVRKAKGIEEGKLSEQEIQNLRTDPSVGIRVAVIRSGKLTDAQLIEMRYSIRTGTELVEALGQLRGRGFEYFSGSGLFPDASCPNCLYFRDKDGTWTKVDNGKIVPLTDEQKGQLSNAYDVLKSKLVPIKTPVTPPAAPQPLPSEVADLTKNLGINSDTLKDLGTTKDGEKVYGNSEAVIYINDNDGTTRVSTSYSDDIYKKGRLFAVYDEQSGRYITVEEEAAAPVPIAAPAPTAIVKPELVRDRIYEKGELLKGIREGLVVDLTDGSRIKLSSDLAGLYYTLSHNGERVGYFKGDGTLVLDNSEKAEEFGKNYPAVIESIQGDKNKLTKEKLDEEFRKERENAEAKAESPKQTALRDERTKPWYFDFFDPDISYEKVGKNDYRVDLITGEVWSKSSSGKFDTLYTGNDAPQAKYQAGYYYESEDGYAVDPRTRQIYEVKTTKRTTNLPPGTFSTKESTIGAEVKDKSPADMLKINIGSGWYKEIPLYGENGKKTGESMLQYHTYIDGQRVKVHAFIEKGDGGLYEGKQYAEKDVRESLFSLPQKKFYEIKEGKISEDEVKEEAILTNLKRSDMESSRQDRLNRDARALVNNMLHLILDDAINEQIEALCEAEEQSSEAPQAISINSPPPSLSSLSNQGLCANSQLTTLTAQAAKTTITNGFNYQASWTITACKQELQYIVYLANSMTDRVGIASGISLLGQATAASNSFSYTANYNSVCVQVSDLSIGDNGYVCFNVV